VPKPYQTYEDVMVGGRTARSDYNPNKRGLVDEPGGYWGPHGDRGFGTSPGSHGGTAPGGSMGGGQDAGNQNDHNNNTTTTTPEPAPDYGPYSPSIHNTPNLGIHNPHDDFGLHLGPNVPGPGSRPSTRQEWSDYFANEDIDDRDRQAMIDAMTSTNVSNLSWGGPNAFREGMDNDGYRDYKNLQKMKDLPQALKDKIGLDDVNQDVYGTFFGHEATQSQMEAAAKAMGYANAAAMSAAIGKQTSQAIASYHGGLTSLSSHVDAFAGLGETALNALTPQQDASLADLTSQYGKLGLTGLAADNVMGLVDTYGFDPVAKALGALGVEAKMAAMMFGIATGKPAHTASVKSWTKNGETMEEALENGTITASDVMKSDGDNMQGSVGFGIANSGLGQMLGMNSYAGGYVDADKAAALGFSYSGSTQGMNDAQFGMVQGNLADPYGQTMSHMMGSNMAPDRGDGRPEPVMNTTQQGSSTDQGTGDWTEGQDVPVDTSTLDPSQMQIFNQMKGYGYSDEYAFQYATMIV